MKIMSTTMFNLFCCQNRQLVTPWDGKKQLCSWKVMWSKQAVCSSACEVHCATCSTDFEPTTPPPPHDWTNTSTSPTTHHPPQFYFYFLNHATTNLIVTVNWCNRQQAVSSGMNSTPSQCKISKLCRLVCFFYEEHAPRLLCTPKIPFSNSHRSQCYVKQIPHARRISEMMCVYSELLMENHYGFKVIQLIYTSKQMQYTRARIGSSPLTSLVARPLFKSNLQPDAIA